VNKQACRKCGAMILRTTAEKNQGLCAKCAKPKGRPIVTWAKALGGALLGCLLAYPTLSMARWNWSHVVNAEHWGQKIIPLAMFLVTGLLALICTVIAPLAVLVIIFTPVVLAIAALIKKKGKEKKPEE